MNAKNRQNVGSVSHRREVWHLEIMSEASCTTAAIVEWCSLSRFDVDLWLGGVISENLPIDFDDFVSMSDPLGKLLCSYITSKKNRQKTTMASHR